MDFLKSVKAEDIDDSFNPFKMKDKWMKFFRSGLHKPVLDTDRVLKNVFHDLQFDYINDEYLTFNDMQMIKALVVLANKKEKEPSQMKDKILHSLLNNINQGKFEMKRGNTIASFA